MSYQYSATVNNAKLDAIETAIGTAPLLRLYTGSMPANCAAAATGTQLTSQALPSDWMGNASGASKAKAGTWSGSYSAAGTVGYGRLYDSTGTTCHWQGTVGQSSTLVTSATTAANSNVLTFASVSGVSTGQNVSGTGIPTGATVIATSGTTVTLSMASTAGVGSGVTITFSYDMTIDNAAAANGQNWTVNTFTINASNQ